MTLDLVLFRGVGCALAGAVVRDLGILGGLLVCISASSLQGQAVISSWLGNTRETSGFSNPPDPSGAVSETQVMVVTNGRWAVYDRSGTLQQGQSSLVFWAAMGINLPSPVDPRVLYDPVTDRWFTAAVEATGRNVLVGVSKTSDPRDGWNGFRVNVALPSGSTSSGADFAMIGLNAGSLVVSANMGGTSPTISVANFPVADLVQAVPTVANASIFRELPFAVNGFFLHPVNDLDGSGGSGRATLYAGSLSTGVGLAYKQATVTGTGAAGAVFNGNTANDTVSFPQSRTIGFNPTEGAQPDGARSLDIGSTVLLSQPVMRNGTTWLAHSADETGDGLVDIFWTQLAADGSVLQNGVISDPQRSLIFPSISLNEAGDVLVTTATTSASEYPGSMAYIGRTVGGVTSFGSMTGLVLYEGTQSHQLINANNRNRWGDWSTTVPDPLDPNRFWTFQQVVVPATGSTYSSNWGVQVSLIALPEASGGTVGLGAVGLGLAWGVFRRGRAVG